MRSIWKGFISFGLVNIPVALYPAVEEKELHFHQLHEEDGGRVGYNKVCKVCGRTLEQDEIVKGYEIDKGRYVTLADEDFEKVARASSRSIAIQQFVDASAVDPIYFEKAYYLGPEEAGQTPYALLVEALKREGKIGIAKMVMRDREYLAEVRPVNGGLVLSTMHFPDEVRKPEGIGIPTGDVKLGERELEMANLLVKSMTEEFDPDRYQDTYRQELLEMIHKKAEGAEYEAVAEVPRPTNVIDIVSRLKESIEQAEERKLKKAS